MQMRAIPHAALALYGCQLQPQLPVTSVDMSAPNRIELEANGGEIQIMKSDEVQLEGVKKIPDWFRPSRGRTLTKLSLL
jgi:hypothetical protein